MVHDLHSIVDSIEGIVELLLGDDQRRGDVENRSTHPHKDSVLEELLLELNDCRRVRVLELSLDQLAILANEVKSTEESGQAPLSEAIVLGEELLHALIHDLLHLFNVTNNIFLNHVFHGLISSDATDGVSLIGGTPADSISPIEILDVFSEPNGGQR